MIRCITIAIFSLCIFMSCNNSSSNSVSRFYEDGTAKPIIAISSVIDSTCYEAPWSLSEELTHLIKVNLSKNKNLYLSSTEEVDSCLSNVDNPFDINISWMKDRFNQNEFLVFLELLRHDELRENSITNLDMSVRIRIVDVRSREPKIVLQECITDNYYIEKGAIRTDYQNTIWGSEEFDNSRMGMAHKQLAQIITKRIIDYISLSKSR